MSKLEDSIVEQPVVAAPAKVYGAVAEFENPQKLLAAIRGAQKLGYRKLDASSGRNGCRRRP